MIFIFVILGLILLLDVLCLVFAARLTRGGWRWATLLYLALQVVGLLWLIATRFSEAVPALPVPVLSSVYVWHLIGLVLFLVAGVAVCSVAIIRWVGRKAMGRVVTMPSENEATPGLTRREFLGAAAAVAPPLVVTGMTTVALTQLDSFRVRRIEVPIPQLPPALDGLTIAHVSDMHVGTFTSGRVLHEMVAATNALKPDLILLTGDLINHALDALPEAIATVKALEGRFGVWTIEGNHDLIEDGEEFERQMRASGLNFLLNESATISVHGHPVQILGLRWVRRRAEDYEGALADGVKALLTQREAGAFPILLAHHPHAFDTSADAGVPLTLSGHTHGGQLMVNERQGFGPALYRYWSGCYERGDSRIVVSNGVGNWFPLRVNAPAEVIHLTLRQEPSISV